MTDVLVDYTTVGCEVWFKGENGRNYKCGSPVHWIYESKMFKTNLHICNWCAEHRTAPENRAKLKKIEARFGVEHVEDSD